MTYQSKKEWVRASEVTREFPKNRYNFSHYLRSVGDFIQTYPMEEPDVTRIIMAAHAWAYAHKCRVKAQKIRRHKGHSVRITLTHLTRIRDYK